MATPTPRLGCCCGGIYTTPLETKPHPLQPVPCTTHGAQAMQHAPNLSRPIEETSAPFVCKAGSVGDPPVWKLFSLPTLGQLRACLPSCVGCVCAARGSWPSCPQPLEPLAPRLCVWNPWKGSLPTRRASKDGDVDVRILHLCSAWIWLTGNQALSRQQRRAALPHKDTHLRGPGLRLEAASPLCLFTPPRPLPNCVRLWH